MIDPKTFTEKQFELAAAFGTYVFDHPEIDAQLPQGAYVFFEIEGELEFNRFSRELAEQQQREEAAPIVLVHIKGLAPGYQLLEPVVETLTAVA